MKKTLLSIMAFALSLTAVNAQTKALAENQEYMPAHGVVTATTGDATKSKAMMKSMIFIVVIWQK